MIEEAGAFADKYEVREAVDAWLLSTNTLPEGEPVDTEEWGTSEAAQREMMKAMELL